MQVVGTVVDCEVIFLTVHRETTFTDAVAIPADKSTQKRFGRMNAAVYVVVPLDDIGHMAVAVGHHDCHEGTTVVGDGYFHSVTVCQDKQIRFPAVYLFLEVFSFQSAKGRLVLFHDIEMLRLIFLQICSKDFEYAKLRHKKNCYFV